MYEIEFTARAKRQFLKLIPDVQTRLQIAIDNLADDPRPNGVKKLKGRKNEYRIRIGSYRVIYKVEDHKLLVTIIESGLRSQIYE